MERFKTELDKFKEALDKLEIGNTNKNFIVSKIENADIELNKLKEDLNKLKIEKPPITFLQIVNKPYDELLASKYLAYFLDENNTTREVVKQLLQINTTNNPTDFESLLDESTFNEIQVEDQISKQNRLDIVIKYDKLWIVLENKISASESKSNQTIDYQKELENQFEKGKELPIKYFYLKPNWNKSQCSNKNFETLTYTTLCKILSSLQENNLNNKESFPFLIDFISHIKEFFMKDQEITINDTVQFYLDNKNKLNNIIEAYNRESEKICDILVKRIKEKYSNYNVDPTHTYIQIYKNNWENKSHHTGIHFEICLQNGLRWDSMLGETVKIKTTLHNEKTTNNKYSNIIHNSGCKIEQLSFKNNDDIQQSINTIIENLSALVEEYEQKIDNEIKHIKF